MFHDVQCITFDLDDTLWDIAPTIRHAEAVFYQWLELHYPHITQRKTPADLFAHRLAFMREHPAMRHDLTRLRKAWLEKLARATETANFRVDEGFQVYWEARNEVQIYDHVEQTLEQLGAHYAIGAITNGNASVERIGIAHLFDFVVTSAQAGAAKPNREIFAAASRCAGIPIAQLLHVGDDAEHDVAGALAAGARAVWVTGDPSGWRGSPQPQLIVAHVRELLDHLPAVAVADSSLAKKGQTLSSR
ncbi:MAG: HAD family hydrolase [Thiotrichales bacterium]